MMMLAAPDRGPRGFSTYSKSRPNIRVVYIPYGAAGDIDPDTGGRPLFSVGKGCIIQNYDMTRVHGHPFWVFLVDISGECVADGIEMPHDFDFRALLKKD
jgi:hypothetical protein